MSSLNEAGGPDTDVSTDVTPDHWGSFSLGGAAYAVPLRHLREAVPAGRLTVWPGTAACVIGAVELRGLMLPVIDLRRLAGAAEPAGPGLQDATPLVVVIAHDGHLLGLCADAVTGIFQAPAVGLQTVTMADGSAPCVRGALMRPDLRTLVSVLHPPALMTLPQVPRCADPRAIRVREGVATHAGSGAPGSVHWLLVQAGDWRLAIDSARVRMAVPLDGLRPSVLSQMRGNADCLGEWPHPSHPIAVIDPLVRCGLGALADGQARQALLLDTDGGLLGLAIGAVLDVRQLPAADLHPVPGGRLTQPDWFAGVLKLDALGDDAVSGPVLALDAARWTAHPELTGMASLHGDRHDPRSAQASRARAAAALTLVTYALPAEAGSPIAQIDEVLAWPTDRDGLEDDGSSPWLGLVMHRNHPIVLLCLSRWSGVNTGPVDASASILVVRSGHHRLGIVVPRLLAIEPAGWQSAVTGVLRSRNPTPISANRLAQIDAPTGIRRLVPVLDLQDIAARALAVRPQALAAA